MRTLCAIMLMLAALSTGCATDYAMSDVVRGLASSGLFETEVDRARAQRAFTDGEIARLLDAEAQAKLPTKLAVAKLNLDYSYGYNRRSPGLETLGAEELASWEKVVSDEPLITGVQPIAALAVRKSKEEAPLTLSALREAAARQNSELLLIYVQDDRYLENLNDAAILYWTVIGLWVVPGTDIEQRTVMQAVLVDSRTGSILGTATGEDHPKKHCAAAFTEVEQVKLEKKTAEQSLKDLQADCGKLLKEVVATSGTAALPVGK